MRRLIFRPLVLLLTFLTGLFLTFLLTFVDARLSRLLAEPSETIPALCPVDGSDRSGLCVQSDTEEYEEYAVYSTLINQLYAGERGDMVIIRDQTLPGFIKDDELAEAVVEFRKSIPFPEQETFDSLRARNQQSRTLKNLFGLPVKIKFIDGNELLGYFSEGAIGWQLIRQRYPEGRGILGLSGVGFNRDMSQAMVYRSFTCGMKCGHGSLVFLVKEGGAWRVKGEARDWVS